MSAPGGGTPGGRETHRSGPDTQFRPDRTRPECEPFVVSAASSEMASVFLTTVSTSGASTDPGRDDRHPGLSRAAAVEFGAAPAAGCSNLLMTGGDATLEEMIAATERGLLLTTLWYIREVDPTTALLTGLTRDGVYLIEDGTVSAAVNNFRFNESPLICCAAPHRPGSARSPCRANGRTGPPGHGCRCASPTSTCRR